LSSQKNEKRAFAKNNWRIAQQHFEKDAACRHLLTSPRSATGPIKRGLTHSRALRFYSVQYLGSSGVSKLCLVPYTEQTKDTKTLDRTSTLLAAKMM
jgi:hypothetical protein